jgi:two-component system, chemotaxis family, chemotaxis protein CheY
MSQQKQKSIVIVEDNPVIRELLRGLIKQDDQLTVVGETASGETAIELAKNLNPDLVCLDVMLPGIGGLEVLRAIRTANPNIRVILVTGHATPDVVQGALKAGASGFVVKPFNAKKLLQTIHGALGSQPPALPPAEPSPASAEPAPLTAEAAPPATEPKPPDAAN